MAGNVREWGVNEIRDERERRVTLGGRWNDPGYMFTLADNVPAFDRSSGNGLRLVEHPGGEVVSGELSGPFARALGIWLTPRSYQMRSLKYS